MIRLVCRVIAGVLFDVDVDGADRLPAGPAIVAGAPHRNWVEPFLMFGLLPRRPVWIADRRAVTGSRLRAAVARAAGGVIAVGRGGDGFEAVVADVRRSVDAGRALIIFPETGRPSGPPDLRTLSAGLGHLSARAQAPVVPVVFGGTHELYLRRRLVVHVLPAIDPPDSVSRPAIHEWMDHFEEALAGAAAEAHRGSEAKPPRWKVGRWLTGTYPRAE
jgi:1-acyl-sn-glycerol-3-phosphate acyltransferase